MIPAFRLLGLEHTADERAVKRAYAARLRQTRPDEDPAGFQRLHEAYQAALAWVRAGAAALECEEHDIPDGIDASAQIPTCDEIDEDAAWADRAATVAMQRAVHSASETPHAATADAETADAETNVDGSNDAFDHEAFLSQCFELALYGRDGELKRWLDAQPALWSLSHKARIGAWLLYELRLRQPPIPPTRFDILMAYFGLSDVTSSVHAYQMHWLRHRLQLVWELQTTQMRALAERTTAEAGTSLVSAMRQTARILRQVSRPFAWPQALGAALMPFYPGAVRRFLWRLDFGNLHDLPPPIDASQVAFWDAAGDRSRFSRERWAVGAARVVAYAAVLTLLHGLLGVMSALSPGLRLAPWAFMATTTGVLAGLWLLWLGHDAFTLWQSQEEDDEEPRAWLRRWTIPVVTLSACALILGLPAEIWAGVVGGLALTWAATGAWIRHRARSGPPLGRFLGYWRTLVLFMILSAVGRGLGWLDDGDTLLAIAALTLFIWAKDLWHQRRT